MDFWQTPIAHLPLEVLVAPHPQPLLNGGLCRYGLTNCLMEPIFQHSSQPPLCLGNAIDFGGSVSHVKQVGAGMEGRGACCKVAAVADVTVGAYLELRVCLQGSVGAGLAPKCLTLVLRQCIWRLQEDTQP